MGGISKTTLTMRKGNGAQSYRSEEPNSSYRLRRIVAPGDLPVPLFEIDKGKALLPFRQLRGGEDLYESELEELLWENLEEITGESLFRVAKQPRVGDGRPDIVALSAEGHVVVIEIKRDVDRNQLAQCLEYAGWARRTSLDELARIYFTGTNAFFSEWQTFTGTTTPVTVDRSPRLILVARDLHGRTESAFEYLQEHGLPVRLIRVRLYEDKRGRKFVDVENEIEDDASVAAESGGRRQAVHHLVDGRRLRLSDLIEAGLLSVGDELTWERPRFGTSYTATVTEDGALRLADGRVLGSPSRAAMEAANVPSYDGWMAWRTKTGLLLADLRSDLLKAREDVVVER